MQGTAVNSGSVCVREREGERGGEGDIVYVRDREIERECVCV